ncbi:MAG: HD domain-containing protein [bacterium]|nr:HD domain-containing protein [bacterium]
MKIGKALEFARVAHIDQVRKYTNEPYISHPMAVAGLVAGVGGTESMVIAAILHDVVEDTHVEIDTIEKEFGLRVARYVSGLTDISKPEDGNRRIRKAVDRKHIARACIEVKTIKLADLIDNSKTIVTFDPKFAKVYMEEKRLLLEVLHEGNFVLYGIACTLVENYYLEPEGVLNG